MRKLFVAVGGSLLLASPLANADIVGVGASVSYWDSETSGQAMTGNDVTDLENDLNLDSDSNTNATLYFEHPVPLLPNVRLNLTSIDQSGRGELSTGYGPISAGTPVVSDLELQQIDLTLYYEVLDNWVNLDLGLTARDLSSELTIKSVGGLNASKTEVDAVIPMGYAAARFDLPFTGLSVGGELNAIGYGGDSVYDVTAYGQYEISLLQLQLGYRQISVDYEDGDDQLDIDIDGPFVSAGLAF
ncbi:TIGR04219 family outer membrane beta-barrel protein [Marinobacter zhejiangensis]|uniref:Outer membrane protein n=1 Tax=Marinobacter zhejiangensis TaxID=488535 RepID=A0A1I4RLD7_9GAMM|nr:TIGR04219 family outer membrane beta-barrel protein [Marinobacter zhejiangensis]SFM53075.1 outer membrane protein [Marinobacter zhejiangensis]